MNHTRALFVAILVGVSGCAGTVTASQGDAGGGSLDVPPSPVAPRLIAPLSTATVTAQRPTLHWSLAAGTDGAHVDVCRDRACTTIEQTFDVTGTQATVPTALAAGVHFWRVFAHVGATTGGTASPTWEFFVGQRSAQVDTSWGTVADFNGDGYADVVVGEMHANDGLAYVYLGSAAGLATTPATTLTAPDGDATEFGVVVASAGDVNGDGYADLVVGADCAIADLNAGTCGSGRVYVYLGSATGLATTPATTLSGPDGRAGRFGDMAASAGDVNGDGYADLVVAATLAPLPIGGGLGTGRAYVYLGSAGGLPTTPAMMLTGPDGMGSGFGADASAGDVNGDGYSDLVVSAPDAMAGAGRTYVYLGSMGGLAATPSTTLTGSSYGTFGSALTSAGDVNGDGYADLVVGALCAPMMTLDDSGPLCGAGQVYTYLGSASGLMTTPATTFTGSNGLSGGFGGSVASVVEACGTTKCRRRVGLLSGRATRTVPA